MMLHAVIASAQQQAILNGREYAKYPYQVNKGHAYFCADTLQQGSVMYDGVACGPVKLLYDESSGALITRDASSVYLVQLVTEKIDSFSIGDHRFLHLRADSINFYQPPPGFYEILHAGRVQALKKEKKRIRENIGVNTGFERYYQVSASYYLRLNGEYHQINGQKDLLGLFPDIRRDLRQYARDNKLSYRRDPDKYVRGIASYAGMNGR